VVLIHGLESDLTALDRLAAACRSADLQVLRFDYPNDGPLAWAGDRLSDELKRLATLHPQFRTAIIAHSMGGLVARYCVEMPDKEPGCITDLFFLATPNAGTQLADIQTFAELWFELLKRCPSPSSMIRDGLGEAAIDLQPDSRFLRQLNAQCRPGHVRYHVGIGSKGWFGAEQRAAMEQELRAICQRRQTSPEHHDTLLTVLQAPECCSGEGDGAVSIQSARLGSGVASQRVFDLNHWEMISLPDAASGGPAVMSWILQSLSWDNCALPTHE
jgi:pimeloyl-ACP methyl ester carboxylesterase